MIVSSFYKYVDLENLEEFQKEHLEFCKDIGINGKILLAEEGINGTVSGTEKQIQKYENKLLSYSHFSDIKFKRTKSKDHPFRKTIVRIRKEIVTSRFGVTTKKVGKYISPSELKKMYDNKEDFVIVDARNDYESKIGKFKDAITPKIETFRDFSKVIRNLRQHKTKKIILYCTGGVRCEKASAVLIKEGFWDINQLEGGILNYIEKYPDTYFEGRCFVFDDRLSINTGNKTKDISMCEKCHIPCGDYINCKNKKCDKLFICCNKCKKEYKRTCSKRCKNIINN